MRTRREPRIESRSPSPLRDGKGEDPTSETEKEEIKVFQREGDDRPVSFAVD